VILEEYYKLFTNLMLLNKLIIFLKKYELIKRILYIGIKGAYTILFKIAEEEAHNFSYKGRERERSKKKMEKG